MNILSLLKENKGVTLTALTVVALLGGTAVIELPADKEIRAVKTEQAQRWEQQYRYDHNAELERIRWRMSDIAREINRINMIPQYLGRPLTAEEAWQIEQLKMEFELLKEREQSLIMGAG